MKRNKKIILRNFKEIKKYFQENSRHYYFLSATNFNLINLHNWVKHWFDVNLIDCYDDQAEQVVLPKGADVSQFDSIESINRYLLDHNIFKQLLAKDKKTATSQQAIFLFFDKEAESMAKKLSLDIALPNNELVRSIDNKITTTQIGNEAAVYSVPNALVKITKYSDLEAAAKDNNLGKHWVVQCPYGDSGKTTFFISCEEDYKKHASVIENESKVKVMKRIRCLGVAIEAVATKWGTFVGPLMSELIGFESLTPYRGGWCGNELYADGFSESLRRKAVEQTQKMGDALYQRGYRGYYELDYLIDLDSGDVYLGEINPRITGISAMTNSCCFSKSTIPLFLFHLLEYDSKVELGLLPRNYNEKVIREGAKGVYAQLIVKSLNQSLQVITQAPKSGVYQYCNGVFQFKRSATSPEDIRSDDECFLLRIMAEGEYAYSGADLVIAFVQQALQDQAGALYPSGEMMIASLRALYEFRDLSKEERTLLARYSAPDSLKGAALNEEEV